MDSHYWIAGLFVYLVVGGLLILKVPSLFRDVYLAPDWDLLIAMFAWPFVIPAWWFFRGPNAPEGAEPRSIAPIRELGAAGVAVTDLSPTGTVEIAGRQRAATAIGPFVRVSEQVEIVGRVGRILQVRAFSATQESPPSR